MKLKDGMVLGHVDGEDFAIATGKAMKHFNGVIHNNPTAAFLFELLQTEQTEPGSGAHGEIRCRRRHSSGGCA